MFLLLLIAVPAAEVVAFIEVGEAIGWLLAVALLLASSVVGTQLLRVQARAAMAHVSLAVSEHRPPGRAALDGALGMLGAGLLVVPGFLTDALGVALLLPPTRALLRGRISSHYSGRVMGFATTAGRFASRYPSQAAPGSRGADVDAEATAVEDSDLLEP